MATLNDQRLYVILLQGKSRCFMTHGHPNLVVFEDATGQLAHSFETCLLPEKMLQAPSRMTDRKVTSNVTISSLKIFKDI